MKRETLAAAAAAARGGGDVSRSSVRKHSTTKKTKMEEQDGNTEDVVLEWRLMLTPEETTKAQAETETSCRSAAGYAEIKLQPRQRQHPTSNGNEKFGGETTTNNKSDTDENALSSSSPPSNLPVTTTTTNILCEADTGSTAATPAQNSRTVPDSVLQYERQLRKAQHAKKAGLSLEELGLTTLEVLYLDSDIVAVNKPPGVLSVPGINTNPSLLHLVHVEYYEGDKDHNNDDKKDSGQNNSHKNDDEDRSKMIVHRLDMDTSGIVVFGRRASITNRLHAIFRKRDVAKEYEAIVMGHWPTSFFDNGGDDVRVDHGWIDLPLQRDHAHPPFMRVSTPRSEQSALAAVADLQQHGWKKLVRKAPKQSQTEFFVVERGEWTVPSSSMGGTKEEEGAHHQHQQQTLPYTRLRLIPHTGRTHQLRVHCAALGFPIVGDPTYGLYGEAHPCGGLDDVTVVVMMSSSSSIATTKSTSSVKGATNCHQPPPAKNVALEHQECDNDKHTTFTILKPSLDVLRAWTKHYPPNDPKFPMCLHSARLAFEHPTKTGERVDIRAEPTFFRSSSSS